MESGQARARRHSRARADHLSLRWHFNDGEMAQFRSWFDDPAGADGGAAWFSLDLPLGDGGIVTRQVRFSAPWRAQLTPGLRWVVSAALEVR